MAAATRERCSHFRWTAHLFRGQRIGRRDGARLDPPARRLSSHTWGYYRTELKCLDVHARISPSAEMKGQSDKKSPPLPLALLSATLASLDVSTTSSPQSLTLLEADWRNSSPQPFLSDAMFFVKHSLCGRESPIHWHCWRSGERVTRTGRGSSPC